MGRYHAARAQRVDLLDYIRQKSGDEKYQDRQGTLEAKRRNAKALLLGWVSTSVNHLVRIY